MKTIKTKSKAVKAWVFKHKKSGNILLSHMYKTRVSADIDKLNVISIGLTLNYAIVRVEIKEISK